MLRALGGDVLKREFRSDTPEQVVEFCQGMLRYNPSERSSWEKNNPLEKISDLRLEVFGRRHLSDKVGKAMLKSMKGGDA